MLLSLLLAQADAIKSVAGRTPVLLLDEVVAHLDHGRRQALFETLAQLDAQCWLSGTDEALFDGLLETTRFRVDHGQLALA